MKMLRVLAGSALVSGVMATGSIEAKDDKGDCEDPKTALSGFYVSAGGGYSSQKSTVDVERMRLYWSAADEAAYIAGGGGAAAGDTAGDCGDLGYQDTYIRPDGSYDMYKRVKYSTSNRNSKLTGAVVLGYGKLNGNFYLGAEGGIDIAKSNSANKITEISEDEILWGSNVRYTVKNHGIVPYFRIRLGGYSNWARGLFFVMLGMDRAKTAVSAGEGWDGGFRLSKVVPSVGFGFEKVVKGGVTVRFEGSCRFKSSKSGSIKYKLEPYGADQGTFYEAGQKIKSNGYVVRLMFSRHV